MVVGYRLFCMIIFLLFENDIKLKDILLECYRFAYKNYTTVNKDKDYGFLCSICSKEKVVFILV